jgi:hypothetical protein
MDLHLKPTQKQVFKISLIYIFSSVLIFIVGIILVNFIIKKDLEQYELEVEQNIAYYEMKHFKAMFNYRLNLIREELFQIFLDEKREQILNTQDLFIRRDHWLFVVEFERDKNNGEVKVLKNYLNQNHSAFIAKFNKDELLSSFQDKAKKLNSFFLELLPKKNNENSFLVSLLFVMPIQTQKEVLVGGVLKSEYLYNFCKYFTENFNNLISKSYILDSKGVLLCHPQEHLIGKDFSEKDFFKTIKQKNIKSDEPLWLKIENIFGDEVLAQINFVEQGLLYLFSEVNKASSNSFILSKMNLSIVLGVVLLLSLLNIVFFSKKLGKLFENINFGDETFKSADELVLNFQREKNLITYFQKFCLNVNKILDLEEELCEVLSKCVSDEKKFKVAIYTYDSKEKIFNPKLTSKNWSLEEIKNTKFSLEIKNKNFTQFNEAYSILAHQLKLKKIYVYPLEVFHEFKNLVVLVDTEEKLDKPDTSLVYQIIYLASLKLEAFIGKNHG